MGPRGFGAKKKTRTSKSKAAGISFPAPRARRTIKKLTLLRTGPTASIYSAAVAEYLCAEILELAGNAAQALKRQRITPRHIFLAVATDSELERVFRNVVLPSTGVVPFIWPQLLRNKNEVVSVSKKNNTYTAPLLNPNNVSKQKAVTTTTSIAKGKKGKPIAGRKQTKIDKNKKKTKANPQSAIQKPKQGLTLLNEKKLFGGQTLRVLSADIVNVDADAIVHPTNATFYLGGEIGTRLARIGGEAFRTIVNEKSKQHGPLAVGSAVVTDGIGFTAKRVIHCNGPRWTDDDSLGKLDETIRNCIKLAESERLSSICFPSIGSGKGGFPKQAAAENILRTISQCFRETKNSSIREVLFVLFDQESIDVYVAELARLIDQ